MSDGNTALCFSTGGSISKRLCSWQKVGEEQNPVSCSCLLSFQFQVHSIKEPKKIANKKPKLDKIIFAPYPLVWCLKPLLEEGHCPHPQTPQPWRSSPLPAEQHHAQELPCLCLGLLLYAHRSLAIAFWSRNICLRALLIWKKSIFYFPKHVLFAFCSWLTYKIRLHLSFVLLCPLNVNCKERCLCGSCLFFCFSLKW